MSPVIRPAGAAEMPLLVEWAAAEGWNPGLADAATFHAADAEGFLLAEVAGLPVACLSAVRQGRSMASSASTSSARIGAERGLAGLVAGGHGAAGGARGGAGRRGGAAGELRALRLRPGMAQCPLWGRGAARRRWGGGGGGAGGLGALRRARGAGCAGVPGATRGAAARRLTAPGHRALAVRDGAGAVRGFGVLRPCREGAKIGPLTATGAPFARALFNALAEGAPGPVFLDLPEPNAAALALAGEAGMAPAFETARMYRGPAPALPLDEIFGLMSFELG
ncbi:GNAT family N-acetyltransferase [Teichococcus aestuarii]|uniref:GNAT family N-acetyltransferase n=1 Tax=Teichococcus aestuarii TaxID=568898 RepID=UPI00361DFE03